MSIRLSPRIASVFAVISLFVLASATSMADEVVNLEQPVDVADVKVDGATLFRVRGASSLPAATRAANIADRIKAVAADPAVDPTTTRRVREGDYVAIYAGKTRMLVVSVPDAEVEHLTVDTLAELNEIRVREAIADYRASRTSQYLVGGAASAGVATLVLVIGTVLLYWISRWLRLRIGSAMHARVKTVGIQEFAILRAERLRAVILGVVKALVIAGEIALVLFWLVFVLSRFPWTRGVASTLIADIADPLRRLGISIVESIPNLVFLVILYYVIRGALRMVRAFFIAVERGGVVLSGFEREWAIPTYKIVRLAIVALGLVVAYPYIPGSGSEAFKGVTLFAGIVFSLGSSTAVANIIAGYMMTYRRAFRTGDRVRIGDVTGDVTEMRLQVTHVRTIKNEDVVIPNSQILNGNVINYSTLAKAASLLLHTTVGIGYETPWRQVEAMLLEAAGRMRGLAPVPAPFVLQTALGDFAITYEINVACGEPHRMAELYSELHRNILDVFNEYDVAIMTPAYVADPPDPKVVPKAKWHLSPAKPDDTPAKPGGASA
ncbi:MAG: mechanosensitive ion channel [Burkholderiales bacterium]|nr:mechanosensitive ion channel [Burkholderiales bacterium]